MKINILIIISLLSIKSVSQQDTILFKNKVLIIYEKSAFYKGEKLYNAEADLNQLIKQEKTDNCRVDYEFYYNPLSLVGNYYSYESGEGGIIACGVPGSSLNIQTINLETNIPVSLADVFTEESILKALKTDTWVKKRIEKQNIDLQTIDSFEVLLKTIHNLSGVKFKTNSFAILEYDKKSGNVAVRFVGEAYMGFNHDKHLQLGLWLTPKKAHKKLFKRQIGFKLFDYKNGLKQ